MSTEVIAQSAPVTSLRSRLQTGMVFNLIGAVFNQGSTFVANIVIANLLGRQIFGKYAMVQSTLTALTLVAQLGMGYTSTKYIAEYRSREPQRAGNILGILYAMSAIAAGIMGLTLFASSSWLARAVLKAPDLAPAVAIGSVALAFGVMNGFLVGALAGLESYRTLSRSLVLGGLGYVLLTVACAWMEGLYGAMIGLVLSGLLLFVFLTTLLPRECLLQGIKIRCTGFSQEREMILRFALPVGLTGFTTAPALWLPGAFLVRQPNGYQQMAIYSASYSLMSVVVFVPSIANNVVMSIINHHKGLEKKSEYRWTFWMNLLVTLTIITAGACIFALLGPNLLSLYGKGFKEGYSVLLILLLASIPQGLALAMYQIIQAQAKMWLSFLAVIAPRDILIIVLAYFLIPVHGARGLALAYAIGWAIVPLITMSIVLRAGIDPISRTGRFRNT